MLQLLFVIFLSTFSSFAQLERNSVFRFQGSKVVTTINLQNYVAKRKLLYYIPKSVDISKPTTVVVYLHGGNSNMTQEGALDVADTLFWGTADGPFARKDGIRPIAEKEQFIVVMPTTTAGWNDFTPFYMQEVLTLIRKELNPDPNKIFLLGHSMGAMGICRSAMRLAQEFAMFFPMSGGFQPFLKDYSLMASLFNTKVYITSGEKYEFPVFISWNIDFEQFLKDKNTTDYFKVDAADWQFVIHNGTHNPNMPMMREKLRTFTKEIKRNIYQSNLFGTVYQGKPSPNYILKNEMRRYFWFEALRFREFDPSENDVGVSFRMYSKENTIDLYIDRPIKYKYDTRPHLEKIRLHLSEKLFNLEIPLRVNLITMRGTMEQKSILFEGLIERNNEASKALQAESLDKGLVFEAFLDVSLPRN
jgi:pimeloyl-ACP methyl ester carboxylesterase